MVTANPDQSVNFFLHNPHDVGLEQDGHEGWNSYDFALKSNSTACKILPVRLNATFYYPGSGTNA